MKALDNLGANVVGVIPVFAMLVAVFLVSAFSGWIATFGNYFFIAVIAGGIVSVFLIAFPIYLFVFLIISTLFIAGAVKYFMPGFDRIWWLSYGMASLLYIPVILSFFAMHKSTINNRNDFPVSVLVILFLVTVVFSSLIASSHISQIVVAVKSVLFFGGVWAFMSFVSIKDIQMKLFGAIILLIATFQIIPVLYQYIFVRSARQSQSLGVVEASDSVVGTFGGSMESGGLTAVLAFFLILVVVTLIAFYRDGIISKQRFLPLFFVTALPLFFVEVKAIFILMPLALLILFKSALKKSPMKFIGWALFIASMFVFMLVMYQFLHWSSTGPGFSANLQHSFSYSFSADAGYFSNQTGELTRRGAYELWFSEHGINNIVQTLIGHGFGASRTQGLVSGSVAIAYAPLHVDRVGLVMLLWDLGMLGLFTILLLFLFTFLNAGKVSSSQSLDPWKRSLASAMQAVLPLFLLSMLYRNDIPYAAPMMFLLMLVFGIISWLNLQRKLI